MAERLKGREKDAESDFDVFVDLLASRDGGGGGGGEQGRSGE